MLSRAVSDLCPSVAVELGPINDPESDERALSFIKRLADLEALPSVDPQSLSLYRSVARVHLNPDVTFDFADHHHTHTDVTLTAGIEGVNFHELPGGTTFGRFNKRVHRGVFVLDPTHQDVTDEFFLDEDNEIRLCRSVIPAMYTTDPAVVRQDCLCYFMERITTPAG